ncbi:MAG: hypothetical protein KDI75_05655 [Xanthomonadales bacterium]|nr:hypothetical protein [Xanthomonadales bacterium]
MPPRRFRILAPALVITVLAGVLLYWITAGERTPTAIGIDLDDAGVSSTPLEVPASDANREATAGANRFARRTTVAATPGTLDDSSLPPMPPVDTPLVEVIGDLRKRAEAGEPEATCRLLLDTSACMEHQNWIRQRRMWTERATHTDSEGMRDRMIDVVAANDEASERLSALCEGVEAVDFDDMERLLFQALPRMSNRQRLLFTMSREDGSLIRLPRTFNGGPPRSVSGGILSQYHADNDIDALEQGIREADPLALEGMLLLHMPMSFAKKMFDLREALPDPIRFSGYAMMMQQLYGPESLGDAATTALSLSLAHMDADTRETLMQQVATEVARWRQVSLANPKKLPDNESLRSGSLCGG